MAESQTFAKQIGLTRGKMVLVGVLSVVLVGVGYRQYHVMFGDSEAASPDTTGRVASLPRREASAPSPLSAEQPPSAAQAAPADSPPPATTASALQPATAAEVAAAAPVNQKQWTASDLTTIVAYDPFARPTAFPPLADLVAEGKAADDGGDADSGPSKASQLADAVAKTRLELEQLQQRGVHVIVKQDDQYVAMIGDRTIHVGEKIGNFIVISIAPDGVRVERTVQQ